MLESERLAYLNALGITQYLTLAPIAGAPVLPELAPEMIWPDAPTQTIDEPKAVEPEPNPAPEAAVTPASTVPTEPLIPAVEPLAVEEDTEIPQLDVSKLKQAEQAASVVTTKPVAPKAQRFALAVVTVPEQFRLFIELAVADAPGLSAVEHRMVADLLAALGQANALDHYGAKLYRWPMINNPQMAANPQAARDGLLGFVASAPAVQRSVFLGIKAAALLHEGELGQPFALGQSTPNSIATHALSAMQQDWSLKAQAWQHLRAFLQPA